MDAVFARFAPQELCGAVGNDLIDIHMVAGPRARLEGIDNELVVPR